jgi:hypothetical protein
MDTNRKGEKIELSQFAHDIILYLKDPKTPPKSATSDKHFQESRDIQNQHPKTRRFLYTNNKFTEK